MKTFNIGAKEFEYNDDYTLGGPLINLSKKDRIGVLCQYMKMCGDEAEMQADNLILNYRNVFSTRRNYQDDSLYGLHKVDDKYKPDGKTGLTSLPFEQHIELQAWHSFLGEHDSVVHYGINNGLDKMKQAYRNEEFKALRTDLFQIYWSKGTNVRQWALTELSEVFAPKAISMLKSGRTFTIMSFAEEFYSWAKTNTSQPKLKYSTKDLALDFSICFPEIVDPESFLEAGTGCRKGLEVIKGDKLASGKKTRDDTLRLYQEIIEHEDYPLEHNHYSRIEAQACYFYKHLMMKTRAKTKRADKARIHG